MQGKCVCIQIWVFLIIIVCACDKSFSLINSVAQPHTQHVTVICYEKEHLFVTIKTRPYLINIKNSLGTPENGAHIKR